MRNIITKILLPVLITLILISCSENPASAQNGPDTTSHRFTWTSDTLYEEEAFQIYLYDIWGTDENNVWAVGHSSLTRYRIWHYDGNSWKNVYVPPIDHVPTYKAIFGFAQDDFWIVGYGVKSDVPGAPGYFLHYNGTWNRMDNRDFPICLSVWGTSSNNMFFGCDSGMIIKYDGEEFTKYKTGKSIQFRGLWGFSDTTVYAIGTETEENGRYFAGFYQLVGEKIVLLDSSRTFDKGFGMDLWGYDMNNFYSAMDGVYKYADGIWSNQFYTSTIYSIHGNAQNNIFAGGYQTGLYHYNGSTWKKIKNAPYSLNIWGLWCNDDYVFAIQDYDYYRVILKGKMTH